MLVEFALVLPIFMTLALGLLTGGQAYDHSLSVTHAAREGARYAATLAKEPDGLGPTSWGSAVADRVVQASAGDIDPAKAGHFICIALLKPDGTIWTETATGDAYAKWLPTKPPGELDECYTAASTTASYNKVHVLVRRPDAIDTVFYSHGLTLKSTGTARYEGAT